MAVLEDVIKLVKSFKPVDIKGEITNPTVAPVVNYNSPTTNINFQSIELNNTQLNAVAGKITDSLIEGIKNQVVGTIATNDQLRAEVSKIPQDQLSGYLKATISGNATLSEVQPNFITDGTTIFPKPEEVFRAGFEIGSKGRAISNVKIIQNSDKTITIQYDEQ